MWKHNSDKEPETIYHEFDQKGFQIRVLGQFKDGRIVYADSKVEQGTKLRTEEAWSDIIELMLNVNGEDIAVDFITKSEFEEIWQRNITK